jgi:hypothetical protein
MLLQSLWLKQNQLLPERFTHHAGHNCSVDPTGLQA